MLRYGFRFDFHSNKGSVLYYFRDKARYWSKIAFFAARRVCIARTMPWQDVCLFFCLSVRLSHAGILFKRLYISSKFFSPSGSPTILVFLRTKRDGNILTGTPVTGESNARGMKKITIFDQYLALSRKWCKIEP